MEDKKVSIKNKIEDKTKKPLSHAVSAFFTPLSNYDYPWSPEDVDKLDIADVKEYKKAINSCRFYYERDPLASTAINKLVEVGITDLLFSKNKLSENEFQVFLSLEPKLKEFAENMALEYLLSGLVIPEISYTQVNKNQLKNLGIKRYEFLVLPSSMWLRDPGTIKINHSLLGEDPSYFVEIPDELRHFIQNMGVYPDMTRDTELYENLVKLYPDFVEAVRRNERYYLLDNKLVIRRKYRSNSPYPIPYLYPALESLGHKRNLRRMDYSIAARVISAIQLIKIGNDTNPVTEDDEDTFDAIKSQMMWRDGTGKSVEKIFQLFANHTLTIEWIFPDSEALLSDSKYKDINQDIIFALGLPRILLVGETERSSTSEPEFAMMSPQRMMESFRDKIIEVIKNIVREVAESNNFKSTPNVEFKPMNLVSFAEFAKALLELYSTGNISRESLDAFFGFTFNDEMDKKESENKLLKEKNLEEFAPKPFSPKPEIPGNDGNNKNNDSTRIQKEPVKK